MSTGSAALPSAGKKVAVVVLSVVGVSLCAWLVTSVGTAALAEGAALLLPWLPVLFIFEVGRAGCELWSTHAVLGVDAALLRPRRLVLAQAVAYMMNTIMPAGRASGEGTKAALLAPSLGLGRALAVGAAGQAIALIANAGFALVGACCGLLIGAGPMLLSALFGYALITTCVALFMALAARTGSAGRWSVRWPRVHASLLHFDAIVRRGPRVLSLAIGTQVLARAFQAAQLGLLLYVCGGVLSIFSVGFAQALHLVGAAAGDLVPAQMGATDGAFVLAADTLGVHASRALTMSLALHAVQLLGALSAALLAFVLSLRERVEASAA